MTHRNSQTAERDAPDAKLENAVEVPLSSLNPSCKEDVEGYDQDLNAKKGDLKGEDDVRCLGDVTDGGSDVRHDVDGGWAWVVLVTSCLSLAIEELMFSATGMFQVEFQVTFGGSRGFLALIGSLFVTSTGMLAPIAGALSFQLTPRVSLMLGGALISLGLVSASFVVSPTSLLLTYGILGGVGNALTYTPAATAFSAYFVRLRQMANGFIMASSGIGSLLGPFLTRWFLDMHGWRFSLAASGFLSAQLCVLGALVFPLSGSRRLHLIDRTCLRRRARTRTEKEEKERVSGEVEGAGADSYGEKSADSLLSGERRVMDGSGESFRHRVQRVIGRREVWTICVNQMMLMTGYNIQLLHQPSYIRSVGVDSRHFPNLFLTFGLSMMFIRVVGGFVFTRFDRHLIPAMFLSELTMALSLGLLPLYGKSVSALFVFNILTGFSYGVAFMLAVPVLISYIGVDLLPLAYGLLLMCCGSGSILSVSLAGLLYDWLGTYKASFYLAGSVTGTGAFALLLLFCIRRKEKEKTLQ